VRLGELANNNEARAIKGRSGKLGCASLTDKV
jgi:hypothetical protein